MKGRIGAWVVVLISAAAVAFAAWVRFRPDVVSLPQNSGLLAGVVSVLWASTGALLITLRPRNLLGWLFLGIGTCGACQVGSTAYGWYGVALADPMWPVARWAALLASGLYIPGWLALPTLLLAFYPDGELPARWWRWPVGGAAAGIALSTLLLPFAPSAYDDIAPGPPPLSLPEGPLLLFLAAVCLPLLLLSIMTIWIGTAHRLLRARYPQRQQLAWLACVLVVYLVVSFIGPSEGALFVGLLVPVAVAVGVLRYRLLGIEMVMRRSLVYGTLTAAVVFLYLAVTAIAGAALNRHPLPGLLAAAVVAVGLTPARDRLQHAVDRLLYGERRNPLRAVTRLGNQVADATELDLLPAALTSVVAAVRAPGAEVLTLDGRVLSRVGAGSVNGEILRLRVGGQDVGTLHVATRAAREGYHKTDRELLNAMALQIAVVVRALDLTERLEVERDRVLTATGVERDRLRRDLHDGLGPSLSGVGLGLQAMEDAQRTGDAASAAELLGRIRAEVTVAVNEIRRIIDGLRPVALDELGLVAAVRRHAQTISASVPVDVFADDLPELSAPVETAAYRIVSEALTNVARHSCARHASITMTAINRVLTVQVIDNGVGVANAPEGVGLTSMRRRTEQLGGQLTVRSGPEGTCILATLPLEKP